MRQLLLRISVISLPLRLLLTEALRIAKLHVIGSLLLSLINAVLEFLALYLLSAAIGKAFGNGIDNIQTLLYPIIATALLSGTDYLGYYLNHWTCKIVANKIHASLEEAIFKTTDQGDKRYLIRIHWQGCKAIYDTLRLIFKAVSPFTFLAICCILLAINSTFMFLAMALFAGIIIIAIFKHLIGRNTTRKVRLQSKIGKYNQSLKNSQSTSISYSDLLDEAAIPERAQTASNIFYQQMLVIALLIGVLLAQNKISQSPQIAIIVVFLLRQFITNTRILLLTIRQYLEDVHLIGSVLSVVIADKNMVDLRGVLERSGGLGSMEDLF